MTTEAAVITFDSTATTVTTTNKFGTVTRLQTAKEFKLAKGLKGQEARRQYNAYLRECGKASTAGLAAELTKGNLLVRSFRDAKGSMSVNFIKASAIKDPKAKAEPAVDVDKLVAEQVAAKVKALAQAAGLSEEQMATLLK